MFIASYNFSKKNIHCRYSPGTIFGICHYSLKGGEEILFRRQRSLSTDYIPKLNKQTLFFFMTE